MPTYEVEVTEGSGRAIDALASLSDVVEVRHIEETETDSHNRTPHFWVPDEGDRMKDPKSPHWSDGHVRIERVTEIAAEDYQLRHDNGQFRGRTVADENPSEPDDAPVVVATFVNGSDEEYAFPVSRLERIPRND